MEKRTDGETLKRKGWEYVDFKKVYNAPSYEIWTKGEDYLYFDPRKKEIISINGSKI